MPTAASCPSATQGRVQFRGPSAPAATCRNPEANQALFDGGWLNTGDLGYLAAGELFLTGREKDIIIRGGHNLYPQELEEAVSRLPGVRQGGVAVFPATDAQSGTERLVVLAEIRDDSAANRARIQAEINGLAVDLLGVPADDVVLAPPRSVLKTSSGKIRRAACRELYERGAARRAAPALAAVAAPGRRRCRRPGPPPARARGRCGVGGLGVGGLSGASCRWPGC